MFSMCKYNWGTGCLVEIDHPLAGKNYLEFARRLKQIGLENGIHCNQSHAPFPIYCTAIRPYLKRAIECTPEAGGKICIIHPDNFKSAEENAEIYLELLPFAKECGVKIATENMYGWDNAADHAIPHACATPEDFIAHLNAVNDDFFVACLDIGHAEMKGVNTSAVEMIKALGGRMQALHIHDNDQLHDLHQIPGSMKIDFVGIVQALKEVDYRGYFTLEANCYLKKYDVENVFVGMKELADSARWLAGIFEN